MAFTRWYESYVSYEELVDSYKKVCVKSEEICQVGENQKKIIANLRFEKEKPISTISALQNEVTLLTFKLDNMT